MRAMAHTVTTRLQLGAAPQRLLCSCCPHSHCNLNSIREIREEGRGCGSVLCIFKAEVCWWQKVRAAGPLQGPPCWWPAFSLGPVTAAVPRGREALWPAHPCALRKCVMAPGRSPESGGGQMVPRDLHLSWPPKAACLLVTGTYHEFVLCFLYFLICTAEFSVSPCTARRLTACPSAAAGRSGARVLAHRLMSCKESTLRLLLTVVAVLHHRSWSLLLFLGVVC